METVGGISAGAETVKTDKESSSAGGAMSSVVRSFRVLEEVAKAQPVYVRQLSSRLGIPKSTMQRTLNTLQEAGWIRQVSAENPAWEVTGRSLSVRPRQLEGGALFANARHEMETLRDTVGETIHLSILEKIESTILIDRVDCDKPVRTFNPIGDIAPSHATANGKAILAFLPESALNEFLLTQALPRYSPTTITSPERLKAELETIRHRGYAVNLEEHRAGVCAIGAPIFDAERKPVAAICISMPASRYSPSDLETLGNLVSDAANRASFT